MKNKVKILDLKPTQFAGSLGKHRILKNGNGVQMEGPSLVIAAEEFAKYVGQKIQKVSGTAALPHALIKKERLQEITSWGKHFLLCFETFSLRVHFLMFGSYRINNPRPNRIPKLQIRIGDDEIYFYSCAIKQIDRDIKSVYDWTNDIMSPQWSAGMARAKLKEHPKAMVCDILMDQQIFSGVGNIMKNEILYRCQLHPESKLAALGPEGCAILVKEARAYAKQFYKWKKLNVLKKNWIVFRKKVCGVCGKAVTKRPTGKGERMSHYCTHCQKKPAA